jgi:hypothetical protein
MDWGFLSGPPNETHHREPVARVGVKQVLLVILWMRLSVPIGQPIVSGNKLAQNHLASRDEERFIAACGVDQLCEIAYELLKPPRENVHSCSPFYQSHCMNMAM